MASMCCKLLRTREEVFPIALIPSILYLESPKCNLCNPYPG